MGCRSAAGALKPDPRPYYNPVDYTSARDAALRPLLLPYVVPELAVLVLQFLGPLRWEVRCIVWYR